MKKILIIFLLLNISSSLIKSNAQITVIDSLENLLQQHSMKDTIKVNLLNETASKLKSINIEKTLKYALESGKLADELNFNKGKAKSLHLLGIYYYYKADYPNAIEYYQKSIKIKEKLNDRKGVSGGLNNIGLIYYYEGNYPKALEYYQKSIKIKEKLNDRNGISSTLSNIGLIYSNKGNYPKAIEYYLKTLKIKKELEDKIGIAYCLNNIGDIFTKQGDYPKALEYLQKSISIKKGLGDKFGLSNSLNNISQIYLELGRYQQALLVSKKALKINEEIGNKTGICLSYFRFGSIYIKLKDYEKALKYTLKSLKIANENILLSYQKDVYKLLSEIYAKTNNYKGAYENYVLYKRLNDSIFNEDNIKKIVGLEYQYKYEKEKQEAELIQQQKDAVKTEEAKRQKTIRNSLIVGFILMLLLVLVVFRSFFQKRIANKILENQKVEIENKNKVLNLQNEEIQTLNEELISSNELLFSQREELKTNVSNLKDMQAKLIRSERMASVGILTSGLAHEINNPLNFVMGGKLAIENYIKENIKEHSTELTPFIEIIDEGIERTSKIVIKLNDFDSTNENNKNNCDIHSIIDNCLVVLKNEMNNKVDIRKHYFDSPYNLKGNVGDLHQVILSILTNSVQALDTGGNITITTKIEKDSLLIKISDNGYGIKKENINKVTDPFYTTKDPGKGTGLGLSITYNIIKEHNGNITFESDGKTGTTVSVRFPVEITKP